MGPQETAEEKSREVHVEKEKASYERFKHVNNHLTPLAILVVVPGLFVASLSKFAVIVCAALIGYSVFMNYMSIFMLQRNIGLIGKIRVVSNYVVNICLIWLLYAAWPPIWLLLLLMAIGPALYQSRRDASITGAAVGVFLLVAHGVLGEYTAMSWAVAGVKACSIFILSLFVSGLVGFSSEA
ncbi:MAG: hypothetical protein ABII00_11435 [Elusimicrobiota bacterium]